MTRDWSRTPRPGAVDATGGVNASVEATNCCLASREASLRWVLISYGVDRRRPSCERGEVKGIAGGSSPRVVNALALVIDWGPIRITNLSSDYLSYGSKTFGGSFGGSSEGVR